MPFEKDPNEIGVLWVKKSSTGTLMMSGEINGEKVVVFPIESTNAKAPNWRVLRSKPKDEMATPAAGQHNANRLPVNDEEIPFAWLLPFIAVIGGMLA